MSKMGKTHFGGQLYGRLDALTNYFKIGQTPSDLSLFKQILDSLGNGVEGEHTSVQLHDTIILPVESKDGHHKIDIIYPDYGGEQITNIVELRQIPENWQQQIQNGDHWFLFIRLDLMEDIDDVTTKFYQQIEEEEDVKEKKIHPIEDLAHNSSAFYVELLQIFLYVKKVALPAPNKPKLTVLLSCWDKLGYAIGTLPEDALKQKMPLLSNFIADVWGKEQYQITGLSALGRDLDKTNPDKDYQKLGPESFGYIILPNGNREDDITQILTSVIQ